MSTAPRNGLMMIISVQSFIPCLVLAQLVMPMVAFGQNPDAFTLAGTVINLRSPAEKYDAADAVMYFVDGIRIDRGAISSSTFTRPFTAADSTKRVGINIVIQSSGENSTKLYNLERVEVIANNYFGKMVGLRKVPVGPLSLGTIAERFFSAQQRVNAHIKQGQYDQASIILSEMEDLYENENVALWEVLKEMYVARNIIAKAVRGRDLSILEQQVKAFERLVTSGWLTRLNLQERYGVLNAVVHAFSALPIRSKDEMRSFADDELTARKVEVLKRILTEMVAHESTAPANEAAGKQATNLKEYYQSPIQFATYKLQAEVYRAEGNWIACMNSIEGYWRYSGLRGATTQDAAAIGDIREKIREVAVWYTACLWRSVDTLPESLADYARSLRGAPLVAKQWIFIADIVDKYSDLLLDQSTTANRYKVAAGIGKFLRQSPET